MFRAAVERLAPLFSVDNGPWWPVGEGEDTIMEHRGIQIQFKDVFEIVNMARLVGEPQMLPVALFLCATGDPVYLRDGVRRSDGVPERLSDDDFQRCIRGIHRLGQVVYNMKEEINAYAPSHGGANDHNEHRGWACLMVISRLTEDLALPADISREMFSMCVSLNPAACRRCQDSRRLHVAGVVQRAWGVLLPTSG